MVNTIKMQGVEALNSTVAGQKQQSAKPGSEFLDIFKNSLNSVNENLQQADKAVSGLIAGEHSNIHETMIAMEKANVSFRLLTKAQNKVISAYQEVMRTQL